MSHKFPRKCDSMETSAQMALERVRLYRAAC